MPMHYGTVYPILSLLIIHLHILGTSWHLSCTILYNDTRIYNMHTFTHTTAGNAARHALELSIAGWTVVQTGLQVVWYV